MSNKKRLMAGFGMLVLSMTLALSLSYADHGGKYGKADLESKFYKKIYMIEKNQAELGLPDDKLEVLKKLSLETKKAVIKQDAEIEVIALDIKQKLYENPVDIEGTNKLVDQKYDLKKAKAKTLVEAFAKVKSTLSKDQWAKLKELHKDKAKFHDKMCG